MEPCNVSQFVKMAEKKEPKKPELMSPDQLEKEFWRLQALKKTPAPIYGNEVEFNLMDSDDFNFKTMKTVLNELKGKIAGVNTSFLYIGTWRSSFVWHVEDRDLGGANFLHFGEPKTWNVVPPAYGYMLKELAAEKVLSKKKSQFRTCEDLMRHKRVLMSPDILKERGIPVINVVQKKNEMILVFPFSYHSGFNHGLNLAEAINFGTESWIEYGKRATRCCAKLDEEIVFEMDFFVKKFQKDLYPLWKQGLDIQPHPRDPPQKKMEFMVEMGKIRKRDLKLRFEIEQEITQLKSNSAPRTPNSPEVDTQKRPTKEDTKTSESLCETMETGTETNSKLVKKLAFEVKKKMGNFKKPFQCPLCSYKALKKNYIENHYLLLHTTAKPFKCEQCCLAFKRKELLVRHIRLKHEKRKRFSCDKENCEYKTDQQSDLKKHTKNKH